MSKLTKIVPNDGWTDPNYKKASLLKRVRGSFYDNWENVAI